MADIKDTLKKLAIQIRDERNTGANTALRVGSLLLAMIESGVDIGELGKKFIRKDIVDFTEFLLKLLGGIEAGLYKSGLSGASIDKDGNAELGSLLTRLKATLAELQVNGDSEFRGNLSSEEFISGFIGGKGWAIIKKEVMNALGVPETKYTAEFDDLIVRGTLRVFEMLVSQLLGENDNRIFTGMMEVDHYDASTGRVWLDTRGGTLYNPFRKDDYIMVQQYNGMPSEENEHYVTKHYELVITGAGVGNLGDKEDRLDWVTFKNFTCSMEGGSVELITKGDTFVRVDNATDPDRKGIIQLMTVGNTTPYMDIIYGLKTDPDNYLKGRLGNLQGIRHHLFGWLQGFGELLTNLYAVGDFRLRQTGESLDSKIEMLKGQFTTSYRQLNYALTAEDNYLKNATFTEDMAHWVSADDVKFLTVGDEVMIVNRSTMVLKDNFALIEDYDGTDMLHLCNSEVTQLNADIRKPGTHKEYKPSPGESTTDAYVEVKDTLYLSVRFMARTSGTLTVGFPGADRSEATSMPLVTLSVNSSYDWQTVQVSGTWDGVGDFVLKYTGDMYVSLLAVTDKALDDYRKELSTAIEQTASNIRITGQNINNLKNTVTNLGIELDAAKENITIYADKLDKLTGTVTNLGIRLDAAEGNITIYADKISNNEAKIAALQVKYDNISLSVTNVQNGLARAEAKIEVQADQISMKVEKDGIISAINQSAESITIDASKINLNGATTINDSFRVEKNGTTHIGGFTVDGGLLHWKQNDYFGGDSRSLKLGVSQTDTDGVVDIRFNAATDGRFGVKAVGSNPGGAAIYASTGPLTYPAMSMTYAGYFVGPVDVRDTGNGLISDVCASMSFRVITSRNTDGTYNYHEGVNWNKTAGSPDLDSVRLIVEGGIITGYYSE